MTNKYLRFKDAVMSPTIALSPQVKWRHTIY